MKERAHLFCFVSQPALLIQPLIHVPEHLSDVARQAQHLRTCRWTLLRKHCNQSANHCLRSSHNTAFSDCCVEDQYLLRQGSMFTVTGHQQNLFMQEPVLRRQCAACLRVPVLLLIAFKRGEDQRQHSRPLLRDQAHNVLIVPEEQRPLCHLRKCGHMQPCQLWRRCIYGTLLICRSSRHRKLLVSIP